MPGAEPQASEDCAQILQRPSEQERLQQLMRNPRSAEVEVSCAGYGRSHKGGELVVSVAGWE